MRYGAGVATADIVRANEDASGTLATLQVNTSAARGGQHWVDIALLAARAARPVFASSSVDVIVAFKSRRGRAYC
jgi:hypothetical protein